MHIASVLRVLRVRKYFFQASKWYTFISISKHVSTSVGCFGRYVLLL